MTYSYPFLLPDWLSALEQSGAVTPDTGWTPVHIEQQQGYLPLYRKAHSWGEYVFDQGWAQALERTGEAYYPKLVTAIPFTPVAGPRWTATGSGFSLEAVFDEVRARCDGGEASGWHVLFPDDACASQLAALPMVERLACHFRWHNQGYQSFDDFLARFASRKRKMVKKERAKISQQGIEIEVCEGAALTATTLRAFYPFYAASYLRRMQQPYLPVRFFEQLVKPESRIRDQLIVVQARQQGEVIAAALYLHDDEALYGRYWGALKEVDCLHFELCYYRGIELAIARGLRHFDPGVQGEHKLLRGFEPVITRSFHWLAHAGLQQAVADFCQQEAQAVRAYQDEARQFLPYRQTDPGR